MAEHQVGESVSQTPCVHCRTNAATTEDHWFPDAWYPSTTPADLEKWTFPSCWGCNQRYGQIESRLQSRLALALSPSAPASQGLVDSVRRSMNPARGRNDRDRRARAARREQLMRQSFSAESTPPHAVLPGLGSAAGVPLSQQVATLVAADDLKAFVEKLVRGLTYFQCELLIGPEYEIEMQLLAPENSHIFTDELDRFAVTIDRGVGIRARVARVPDDQVIAVYEFTIWQRLTLFAYVRRRDTQ